MEKFSKLLVTGGAGYVGSVLAPLLLNEGYRVRILDALIFGSEPALTKSDKLEFIKGDARDEAILRSAVESVDLVIHLAALVGEPACRKNPVLAEEINTGIVRKLNQLRNDTPLIFPSTTSVYSELKNYERCDEEMEIPLPTLPYSKTKFQAEGVIREGNAPYIILRPATAFGYSPRLRLDLLPNEFVFKALKQGFLEIYNPYYMRTFLHVRDLAKAILFMLENFEQNKNQIFNVGSNLLNVTKKEFADIIHSQIEFRIKINEKFQDLDQRNFIINYDKISQAGFKPQISLAEGIKEMIEKFKTIEDQPEFYNTNFQL